MNIKLRSFLIIPFYLASIPIYAGTIDLTNYLSVLEDVEGVYTLDQVSSPVFAGKFEPAISQDVYLEKINTRYWVRLVIPRKILEQQSDWILELLRNDIQTIEVHYHDLSGSWVKRQKIMSVSFDSTIESSNIAWQWPLFHLEKVDPLSPIYLRLDLTYNKISFRFWSVPDFVEHKRLTLYTDGLFYGICLAVFAYHILFFFAVGNRSYLYYSLFLLAVMAFFLSAQGWIQSLTPLGDYRLSMLSTGVLYITLVASGIQFARYYLNLSDYAHRVDWWLSLFKSGLLTLLPIGLAVIFLDFTNLIIFYLFWIGAGLIFPIIFLILWATLLGIKNKQITARYYLFATVLSFFLTLFVLVTSHRFMPFDVQWKLFQICSVIEMWILSLGLSKQMKVINDEKIEAREQLLQSREEVIRKMELLDGFKNHMLANLLESGLYPELAKLYPIMNKIVYVKALGNACEVRFREYGKLEELVLNCSLKNIEESFGTRHFIRIHKTYLVKHGLPFQIVRRNAVDFDIVHSEITLPVGRKYVKSLRENSSPINPDQTTS
ncbi:MAG: hypothetical protein GY786_00195 [Proteobacteria bacterium]|nr:hypothetical protein [Pseudomonadota bacterium]